MVQFPNAKVNLGLHILERRQDGYHEIETCIYPVPWCDILEITPSSRFDFKQTGLPVECEPEDNLCVKAFRLLEKEHTLTPVHIHLHKIVPMGAGLGGGSSDAAFTLLMLNDLFELEMPTDELKLFAAQLGSDCPFFIDNVPAIASGTGTDLQPIDLELSGLFIRIVYPNIHVSTSQAYAGVTPHPPGISLYSILKNDVQFWPNTLVNDFEKSVFAKYSGIEKVKNSLKNDAAYAAMSGSGSAVFALYEHEPPSYADPNYQIFTSSLNRK